jgi:hypothetical protein
MLLPEPSLSSHGALDKEDYEANLRQGERRGSRTSGLDGLKGEQNIAQYRRDSAAPRGSLGKRSRIVANAPKLYLYLFLQVA